MFCYPLQGCADSAVIVLNLNQINVWITEWRINLD